MTGSYHYGELTTRSALWRCCNRPRHGPNCSQWSTTVLFRGLWHYQHLGARLDQWRSISMLSPHRLLDIACSQQILWSPWHYLDFLFCFCCFWSLARRNFWQMATVRLTCCWRLRYRCKILHHACLCCRVFASSNQRRLGISMANVDRVRYHARVHRISSFLSCTSRRLSWLELATDACLYKYSVSLLGYHASIRKG